MAALIIALRFVPAPYAKDASSVSIRVLTLEIIARSLLSLAISYH